MTTEEYLTIAAFSEGLYKEKGSKFIGLAYPISDETKVRPILEKLRKEHDAARHFCYAYRVGRDGGLYKSTDDGEPAGTAGKPILNQLLSFQLTYTLVVVVRYFGGTKLGVSGLIHAYKEATLDAIKSATIVSKVVCDWISVEFDYDQLGEIDRILKEHKIDPFKKEFASRCSFVLAIPLAQLELITTQLTMIKNATLLGYGSE